MDVADKEFENRNIIKRPKEEIQREKEKNDPLTGTRKYKAFARECKKELIEVMSLLDKGSKEFNKAFEEIHNKILNFYKTHKKKY